MLHCGLLYDHSMTQAKELRSKQPRRTPPFVSLRNLRVATGMTLEQVAKRIKEVVPEMKEPSQGSLSAIESGSRGASELMLVALARAYGLPDDAITTTYEPRRSSVQVAAAKREVA